MKIKHIQHIISWFENRRKDSDLIYKTVLDSSANTKQSRIIDIKGLYKNIWNQMKPYIRQKYSYMTSIELSAIIDRVDNYIDNSLYYDAQSRSSGIKIGDIIIDGSREQYDNILNNKKNMKSFIRSVIRHIEEKFFNDSDVDDKEDKMFLI
jgi:hypothetical protein